MKNAAFFMQGVEDTELVLSGSIHHAVMQPLKAYDSDVPADRMRSVRKGGLAQWHAVISSECTRRTESER